MSVERIGKLLELGKVLKFSLEGLAQLALTQGEAAEVWDAFQLQTSDEERLLAFGAELCALLPQDHDLCERVQAKGYMPWDLLLRDCWGEGLEGPSGLALKTFGLDAKNLEISPFDEVTLTALRDGTPKSFHLKSDLTIRDTDCDQWRPKRIRVGDTLSFRDCWGDLKLEDLSVRGDLHLDPDLGLTTGQLQVGGEVLRQFTGGLSVRSHLRPGILGWKKDEFNPNQIDFEHLVTYAGFSTLEEAQGLPIGRRACFIGEGLPPGTRSLPVGDWQDHQIDFSIWGDLVSIPESWTWPTGLGLRYFPKLRAMPGGLDFPHGLRLECCHSLSRLPGRLRVGSALSLLYLPRLRTLPNDLWVGGDLNLELLELDTLPTHLHVPGNLLISQVSRLTRLPKRLRIGGNLDLEKLEDLKWIPESVEVGGKVRIRDCPRLGRHC